MKTSFPYISVIIPVHNEERRLSWCLEQLVPFLSNTYHSWEIVVVNNGSTDATREILEVYTNTFYKVYALHLKTRGKGLAVTHGMLYARGRYRYMCDVDLSTPVEEIPRFLQAIKDADVVCGSRELDRASTQTTPLRRFMGRCFHAFVGDLAGGLQDTQCGFKMFRDFAAMDIFENIQTRGMAFDVEVIYLAKLYGLRVAEMPVKWTHNADSRVRLWDGVLFTNDVLNIPWLHMYDGLRSVSASKQSQKP